MSGIWVGGSYVETLAQKQRRIKQQQHWQCYTCHNVNGGRDTAGHLVTLSVHEDEHGDEYAYCPRCRPGGGCTCARCG